MRQQLIDLGLWPAEDARDPSTNDDAAFDLTARVGGVTCLPAMGGGYYAYVVRDGVPHSAMADTMAEAQCLAILAAYA